jgi:hypothetical protein
MVVAGRGYSTTAGQFNYMVTHIRMAASDYQEGRDADALGRIATVHGRLEHDRHI